MQMVRRKYLDISNVNEPVSYYLDLKVNKSYKKKFNFSNRLEPRTDKINPETFVTDALS